MVHAKTSLRTSSYQMKTILVPRVPPEYRKMVIQQLISQAEGPTSDWERCAILAAWRHLFCVLGMSNCCPAGAAGERGAGRLKQIVQHVLMREYRVSDTVSRDEVETAPRNRMRRVCIARPDTQNAGSGSHRFAELMADWIRVGYCQGIDNCLVGGRTMDYGPFGFIEKFEPLWNSEAVGKAYNQTVAGEKNFESFVGAVICVQQR